MRITAVGPTPTAWAGAMVVMSQAITAARPNSSAATVASAWRPGPLVVGSLISPVRSKSARP
ncbi:hypothetical protein D3C85_1902610 [compost metagenome]